MADSQNILGTQQVGIAAFFPRPFVVPIRQICHEIRLFPQADSLVKLISGENCEADSALKTQLLPERGLIVAHKGTGYFDRKGHFFKTGREATESDLAALLGQIGDGESLAPGIAHMIFERRSEIERLFAEHDEMVAGNDVPGRPSLAGIAGKVTKLPRPAG